ncbi:hypothetical protein EBZ38_03710 [bacterium]|nr:hypothetical protein [bacterium]
MAKKPQTDVLDEALDVFKLLTFDDQAQFIKQLEEVHSTAKASKVAELQAALAALGVYGGGDRPRRQRQTSGGERSKAAVKYRDPKTGDEWSGRGRPAAWLQRHLDVGKKKEDFLVG